MCARCAPLLPLCPSQTFIGDPSDALARAISARDDVGASVAQLSAWKRELFLASDRSPEIYPGVVEAVSAICGSGTPTALCTGSTIAATRALLAGTPLDALLPPAVRTTRDHCVEQKPKAAPYTRSCALVHRAPRECVCFEDSPAGLRSATAAGIGHRLGITTSWARQQLLEAGATAVFGSFEEAAKWAVMTLL